MNAETVLEAESVRATALVARDWTALEERLDEQLVYIHATGMRHDRVQWLDYVRTGPRFHEVRVDAHQVREMGNVALVSGELHLYFQRESEPPARARSWVTQVWLWRDGRWRLASFQSTRMV